MGSGIRGLNCPQKHGDVSKLMHQQQCGLFGLLATRVKSCNFDKVYPRVCPRWSKVTNYSHHKDRRIWLIWMPQKFEVDVIVCNAQYIHTKVKHVGTGRCFYFTLVYCLNEGEKRKVVWDGLKRIRHDIRGAWLCCGDFNNVVNLNDRLGSAVTLAEVKGIRSCLRGCKMQEMESIYKAWSNKQEGDDRVFSKIDRVFVNEEWEREFQEAVTHFLPESLSVHSPGIIHIDNVRESKPSSFRFFNMWTISEEFGEIVQAGWQKQVQGCGMYKVVKKLKMLKYDLKVLNKNTFSNIKLEAELAWKRLTLAQ